MVLIWTILGNSKTLSSASDHLLEKPPFGHFVWIDILDRIIIIFDVRSIALSQKEIGNSRGDQPDHISDGGKSQSYMFHLLADI